MALSPFQQAFADARKAGKSSFTFQGKTYATKTNDESRSSGPSTRGGARRSAAPDPVYRRSPAPRDTVDDTPSAPEPAYRRSPAPRDTVDETPSPRRDPMSSEAARRSRAQGEFNSAKDAWWNNEDRSKRDELVDRVVSASDNKSREDDVAGYSKGGLVQHRTKVISTPKSKKHC